MVFALSLVAAVGCGAVGGLLFAFSVAVMKALSRLPASAGIAAMQAINRDILNPVFLSTFLGTALACGAGLIVSLVRWGESGSAWLLAGSVLYLVGAFFVTIAVNVPKNNALAALRVDDPAAEAYWKNYLSSWTTWNHLRSAASLAATAAFVMAART